jgi:hypothetical protein
VKALLAEESDLVVAGEAGTAKETLQRVRTRTSTSCCSTSRCPTARASTCCARFVRTSPNLPILILSMHPEEQFAVSLLRAAGERLHHQGRRAGARRQGDPHASQRPQVHQHAVAQILAEDVGGDNGRRTSS